VKNFFRLDMHYQFAKRLDFAHKVVFLEYKKDFLLANGFNELEFYKQIFAISCLGNLG